jgi:DNA anti-recombination protein RmuC
MTAYYEHSCQQVQDMATEMQKSQDMAREGHLEQVEGQRKALEEQAEARHKMVEESCKDAVESLGQRCQRAEEMADAAVHTSEFILRDTKEELRTEVEALVSKRVDERVDCAFRCIAQRVQGVQLSLQATALGLRDAIHDGKIGEGESESTRSRSRSKSPKRTARGMMWL